MLTTREDMEFEILRHRFGRMELTERVQRAMYQMARWEFKWPHTKAMKAVRTISNQTTRQLCRRNA